MKRHQSPSSSSVYLPISGAADELADSFVPGSEGFKRSRSRCAANPGSCVTRIKRSPRPSFCTLKTGDAMTTWGRKYYSCSSWVKDTVFIVVLMIYSRNSLTSEIKGTQTHIITSQCTAATTHHDLCSVSKVKFLNFNFDFKSTHTLPTTKMASRRWAISIRHHVHTPPGCNQHSPAVWLMWCCGPRRALIELVSREY